MDAMTQSPQELKKQLDQALRLVSQTVEEIGQNPESLIAPSGESTSGRGTTPLPGDARDLFESLMARDQQMIQELMRLQRSLSRQNFRGAESARRLVRRLARQAQQSIGEMESLIGITEHGSRDDLGKNLTTTLDRIRRELKRIKTMEASSSGGSSRPQGSSPVPQPPVPDVRDRA